jgi:hypothetical protein
MNRKLVIAESFKVYKENFKDPSKYRYLAHPEHLYGYYDTILILFGRYYMSSYYTLTSKNIEEYCKTHNIKIEIQDENAPVA